MIAISLTPENAKEMANRLRQFLAAGGTSIKQTHAYEALAKCFGYRDWNTLVGALQSAGAPDNAVGHGATAPSPRPPAMLLLVDRHAMAAHGVTVAHIEAAFRREFPALLDNRTRWETLCCEQLPLRPLPAFRPPAISISLQAPEKAHVHDAVMDCVTAIVEPKWTFIEQIRAGAMKLTFMFFPECDVERLLPALGEALSHLPAEITLLAVERIDLEPDHRGLGKWRSDGVSYFVWAWEIDPSMLLSEQLQIASMALKFNGDALVRLRDVATLHAGVRRVAEDVAKR